MKSHFGAIRIETVREWTTPELYLALSAHKDKLPSPPELRNYSPEKGLYLDATGIYTLYFQPNAISSVTLKLWCPWYELRIAPPRRGSVEANYPGKAASTPLLEQTADIVSQILHDAEAQNLIFDTTLVPPECEWGLSFRAWLPLAVATWTASLPMTFYPPICLSNKEQSAILRRCPGNLNPSDVVFYAESTHFLRPSDVFAITEAGIFGFVGVPFSIVFTDLATINTDLDGTVTLTKIDGSTEKLQLNRFGNGFADIARKAVAYKMEHKIPPK